MLNYDFQVLQPNEFENLTRDLLQKKEHCFIESFTIGKDQGIDLRFAYASNKTAIIQAKRYKDYKSLINSLKKEAVKVAVLKPERYILSTSIGLTPNNKDEIYKLLRPFIKSTEDILGKDDLNNLLALYPEIEKQYYKLWITSSSLLDELINKDIGHWTQLEKHQIIKDVSTYVINDSFNQAKDILHKNRYVIISGIPGVGKTTLARMLIYYILGKGYDELVYISNITDAAKKISPNKKQIFFFDDFLGTTYFKPQQGNFEHNLLAFIKNIRSEKDKLLILTTREYILSSATHYYEHFSINNIDFSKCIIDLHTYTEEIRAKILYNHLANSTIPNEYIHQLLINNQHIELIKHKNFNPRIIEAFLNKELYKTVNPIQFTNQFVQFFDNPSAVWNFAFNSLSEREQYALLVRATMGDSIVYLDDWWYAVKEFFKTTHSDLWLRFTEFEWLNTLKILDGTFITTSIVDSKSVVNLHNPSIYDFLINKISEAPDIQEKLIKSSIFADQIYSIFSDNILPYDKNKIIISDAKNILEKHESIISNLQVCKLTSYNSRLTRAHINKITYFTYMLKAFPSIFKSNLALISKDITGYAMEDIEYSVADRVEFLLALGAKSTVLFNIEKLVGLLLTQAYYLYDYAYILDLIQNFKIQNLNISDDNIINYIDDSISTEIRNASSIDEYNMIEDTILTLSNYIPQLDISYHLDIIQEEINKLNFTLEQEIDEDWAREELYKSKASPDRTCFDMFSSLLSI